MTLLNLGVDLRDLAGSGELVSGSLRAATIYRPEEGEWPLPIATRIRTHNARILASASARELASDDVLRLEGIVRPVTLYEAVRDGPG
jgi:hypothetical protein